MGRATARLPAATVATGAPRTTTEEARVAAAIVMDEWRARSRRPELEGGYQPPPFDEGAFLSSV